MTDREPHARQRLQHAMTQRQEALGASWVDIATHANLTYETVRATRDGMRRIPAKTRRKLEAGLRWPRYTVDRILAGQNAPPATDGLPEDPPTLRPIHGGAPDLRDEFERRVWARDGIPEADRRELIEMYRASRGPLVPRQAL